MTEILLVRHAQSTYNAEGRWAGSADPPLTPDGEAAAAEAGRALVGEGLDLAGSSDLVRARRTAVLVAEAIGLGDLFVDARLRERHVGEWQGLTTDEIEARWPGMLAGYRRGEVTAAPGGEPLDEFLARIREGLVDLARQHEGRRLVVVTHGGVLRAVERLCGADPTPPRNCAGRWVHLAAGDLVAAACWPPEG